MHEKPHDRGDPRSRPVSQGSAALDPQYIPEGLVRGGHLVFWNDSGSGNVAIDNRLNSDNVYSNADMAAKLAKPM